MIIETFNKYFEELVGVGGIDLLIFLMLCILLVITLIRG